MLVKAKTFLSSSRYPSAESRSEYLERNGRAVEKACHNIVDERAAWREMDRTRARYDLRGSVIGREYILSPSPEDKATPMQVLNYATEWVERAFPSAEAVIVIHDDSTDRIRRGAEPIAHAHVYVNSPDLETGRKITVSNTRAREIHDLAQDMSEDRGWSSQPRYYDRSEGKVRKIESGRRECERRDQWERIEARANPDFNRSGLEDRISRFEYERQREGSELDKTFLRRSVRDAAREVSRDPRLTMKEALSQRGVSIARAADGDYKYAREGSKLFFKGKTLDASLERSMLEGQISAAWELHRTPERGFGGLEIG